ncbi:response regulator [Scytonema sp. UIC 10036]|uniref:response regulator n=1 Tax=Scytonema sp. UIC 10036 TaxID=2304196 RepID=UPI0012DA41FB|nr:response regulator [Scytonema sp. UIC 10036]MUH00863.1 response regulator [Scytonema sp. UIC 10036]
MTMKTILVVEDEGIVAKDLQKRLLKLNYHVPAIASSGEEAIQIAEKIYPDLILMDIRLKGNIDGIEAAKEIQSHLDIPIIYLTAYADDNTLERARLTEPFAYVLKPFKEKELHTTIEIALSKHQKERQLKENQKGLVTAVTRISDGLIVCDRQQLVTFINPIAEKITGYRQEEAFGRNLSEILNIVPIKSQSLNKTLTESFQEDRVFLWEEKTLISQDKQEIQIEYCTTSIKNDIGNIIGAIVIFRDMTERNLASVASQKHLEQEQVLAKLSEINKFKDEFLSIVSHELRAPLSNIRMAIQLLQNMGIAEHGQQYINILKAECDREMTLINDLLDLQKAELGTTGHFNPEPLELQPWVLNIVDGFSARIHEHQQTLRLNVPSEIPPLISDNTCLTRIVGELLNNACKYTATGGEIAVSIQNDISTSNTIISISNSTAIPPTALPKIFDKFYRVRSPEFKKQPGTGLGLALAQKLIEQLQGTIEVESLDGWTTFTLKLSNLPVTSDQ